MFGGDKVKWAKFGNTLKLKMLLHTVNTTTFNAQAEIAKINAEGSGFIGNGLSAEVQPGYTSDRPNPFYSAHLFNAQNGNESDNYNRANNFSLNLLSGLNDPRANAIYRAPRNGGALKGTDYGANANAAADTRQILAPPVPTLNGKSLPPSPPTPTYSLKKTDWHAACNGRIDSWELERNVDIPPSPAGSMQWTY
jgi:hypothetical protein